MKKIFTLFLAAVSAANVMAAGNDNVVKYDFENYEQDETNKYYSWFELAEDNSKQYIWGTGNSGFALAKLLSGGAKPGDYPTEVETNGKTGACVKLETKDSYTIFSKKTPIAPGNIFFGSFELDINNPLNSTKFGIAYDKKPLNLSFYYKYKAGEKVTDVDRKVVEGKVDKATAYAVLYDNLNGEFQANGGDILSNENIVGIANAGELGDADEWTSMSVDFEYSKDVDSEKLAAGGYNLALVFTSSINGAAFEGAIGSVMYVDDVVITYKSSEVQEETKEYIDEMNVNVNGTSADPTTTSIFVTKQADGKYTLALKNFYLVSEGNPLPVGSIIINDIEGVEENGYTSLKAENRTITIADGDDEGVDFWMGQMIGEVPINLDAKMTDDKLFAKIDINAQIMGEPMEIHVVFGADPTGVNTITTNTNGIEGIYTINGAKVSNMQQGNVYIIRKADGTTTKVVKK